VRYGAGVLWPPGRFSKSERWLRREVRIVSITEVIIKTIAMPVVTF